MFDTSHYSPALTMVIATSSRGLFYILLTELEGTNGAQPPHPGIEAFVKETNFGFIHKDHGSRPNPIPP